jgi:two-component system chemotaxis response regulator CheY
MHSLRLAMTTITKCPILVVDDFEPMGRIYRHFLKQMGLRDVDVAANGIQALDLLETRRYAAIVSDWHMEPMTGFQLLQSVRAEKLYGDVPFIMATVEARPDRVKAAQRAGATDYILKPFNVATLRSALANASTMIAAAMEPPILASPANQAAARWRDLLKANRPPVRTPVPDEVLVEAFAGPAPVLPFRIAAAPEA